MEKIGILALTLLSLCSCKKEDDLQIEFTIDCTIPAERTFYMGFTAFPYDITSQASAQSYMNQSLNGDILLTHFDHGVPWDEALNNQPFPIEVQTAIDECIANITPNHKVLLTATATDTDRDKLAKYWNNAGSHQPLLPNWENKSFNSPEVITAYKNYCHRIIDAINPDYFAFGIEVNASFLQNSQAYENYKVLADSIYTNLKMSYPSLPIFLTFQDQSFNKTKTELHHLTTELLEYSDYIAVSTYPFWQYNFPERDANPKLFDNNWLLEMRQLAPNKPFAISETGFCAENLDLQDFVVKIKASEKWQKEYAQKVLIEAHKLDAEFLVWFVYRDYDLLESNLPEPSIALKIWRDNGLQNGNGVRRPSHDTWDIWKSLEVQ